jgi:hypothetical protein
VIEFDYFDFSFCPQEDDQAVPKFKYFWKWDFFTLKQNNDCFQVQCKFVFEDLFAKTLVFQVNPYEFVISQSLFFRILA